MRDPYHIWKTAISVTRWIGSPASLAVHTAIFVGCYLLAAFGYVDFAEMQLVLLSIVSLEAIYLSIFIQMTVNYTTQELAEVGEDIEEIREDVGVIQEDVGELQEDVEEISEDVEEITEEEEAIETAEEQRKSEQRKTLGDIQTDLKRLMQDISRLQHSSIKETSPTKPGNGATASQ
ncbi:hypothetical protein A3A39_00190 [Candidatus Kaiserbacteria bacterium RIFCSPLOWO2_01_FULL_54_13]|uniref:DUF1003 domain-containing protein n=1 Tax=Candidatus Kaiserbacteria bacterium RIFCSPLOWO2_01_FULL_54_13 TaxID=1798512 RepID=A0A1F6F3P8_9BACT|nr:MAG: hypothetical protein A3A39_00190 [Candidatus Kaiserbacteria bacterium RIFCSPLOWO2_01_FULL_54_13]